MRTTPDLTVLTRHWLLKLLSLIIGASLWYFVVGEDRVDLVVTIPLELRNLPADLVIANQYKKEIEVAVSGPRRLIQEMRRQNISLPINLEKATPGALVIKNEPESIALPRGIAVQRVQPANITLLVDRLVHKDLTITPVTKGKPAAGFELQRLTLSPAHIIVTGPQTVVDKEQALSTSTIDLEGTDRSSTFQVHLDLNEALLKLLGETVVEANVVIREIMVRKVVRDVPINIKAGDLPTGKLAPATVSVEADIPEQIVHATPELVMLFRASVNAAAKSANNELPVQVHGINLPGHAPIVIVTITPNTVRILP
jgi:YbbR domain-containing protein